MSYLRLSLVLVICLVVCEVGLVLGAEIEEPENSKKFKEAVYLLETWIESVLDFDRLPGVSIAIVHDQQLIYTKGFGYADIKTGLKATPDTIYSICSISKMFTAIALLQLRDAGKLSLDDPVSTYLPWFDPEKVNPDAPSPTLKDLLRHSSGLPCEPDLTIWSDPEKLYPSREELIERVSHLKMSYSTNTQYNYSNLGYALLGEVVSVVSNVEYADYVRQNILEPLKLKETTPDVPGEHAGNQVATGYGLWPRKGSRVEFSKIETLTRTMTSAGGFVSTVRDLAKFAMWQFRVLDASDTSVLERETLKEMHSVQWPQPKWGYGFAIWQIDDRDFVGHQGGCPGYKSQIILCPEEKIAVAVMINATDAPQFTLAFRTYSIIAPALRTSSEEVAKIESGKWQKYTGNYTADRSWAEAEILEWDGSLSVMWLPTGNPLGGLVKLSQIEEGIFREVKKDGTPGKHYAFGTDAADNIISMKFNNNILKKAIR